MQPSFKRKLLAGTVVASIALFTGGAYAASQALNDNSRQAFLNDVAKRLNVTPTQLSAALKGAFEDQLQAAVKAGQLTQAQANAIKQHIAKFPNAPLGAFFGPHFHRAFGPVPGFAPFGGPRAGALHAAAQYLGLTDAELFKQIASGKSLAQITKAKGKSTTELKAKMTAAVTATLDKLRTAGRITAAEEKQILANLSSRLNAQINGTAARFHFRFQVRPGAAGKQGFAPDGLPPGYPGAAGKQGFVPGGPPPGYPGAMMVPVPRSDSGAAAVPAPPSGPVY